MRVGLIIAPGASLQDLSKYEDVWTKTKAFGLTVGLGRMFLLKNRECHWNVVMEDHRFLDQAGGVTFAPLDVMLPNWHFATNLAPIPDPVLISQKRSALATSLKMMVHMAGAAGFRGRPPRCPITLIGIIGAEGETECHTRAFGAWFQDLDREAGRRKCEVFSLCRTNMPGVERISLVDFQRRVTRIMRS